MPSVPSPTRIRLTAVRRFPSRAAAPVCGAGPGEACARRGGSAWRSARRRRASRSRTRTGRNGRSTRSSKLTSHCRPGLLSVRRLVTLLPQLVQLQKDLKSIEETGTQVVGVSYDDPSVLKTFADRAKVTFPPALRPGQQDDRRLQRPQRGRQGKGRRRPPARDLRHRQGRRHSREALPRRVPRPSHDGRIDQSGERSEVTVGPRRFV